MSRVPLTSAHISTSISRREFLRGAAGAVGLLALGVAPASGGDNSRPEFYIDRFKRRGDTDSAPSIRRAINAARASGGGRVVASPGRVYGLTPQATYESLNPSGGVARYNVCLQIPPEVTLDMHGSTLRLLGMTESVLVANANLSGTGPRDAHIGLVNAILDGGNIPSSVTSMLHLAYADHLVLRGVKIVRGNYVGGWIYNCRASVFDDLEVDGFRGEPWLIGSLSGPENQVYDSHFGTLCARNVNTIDNEYHFPGNSFVLVLTRCRVRSIEAYRCDAGIKVQWPSQDVTIGSVITSACGDVTGNSGLKLQGEPGGPVTRISVGKVVAQGQTGPGLYMDGSLDCTVDSYRGLANDTIGLGSDVWIGGTNDHIEDLQSDKSGGPGVVIRPYAKGYRLGNVWIGNPNQSPYASGGRTGVAIYGGSGMLGHVRCIDTQHPPTMDRGVDVNSPDAVGQIAALEVSGEGEVPFKTVSKTFPAPPTVTS
jgi:hypothetical protein